MKPLVYIFFVIFISFTIGICVAWLITGIPAMWAPIITLVSGVGLAVSMAIVWNKEA